MKVGRTIAWLGLGSCFLLSACGSEAGKRGAGFAKGDATRIVHVAPGGVQLGWGWNSVSDDPVPNLCIEFTENGYSAQERSVTVSEVTDQSDLMRHLDMSASMSVSAIGAEVSGKASFSKDVKVNSFQSTFVLDGRVENGVRFVAPKPNSFFGLRQARKDDERGLYRPLTPSGSVRLTKKARKLAKRNLPEFRRICGDSYVASVFSGARLYAVITYETRKTSERKQISAQMKASGWGASIDVSGKQVDQNETGSSSQSIKVFQSGGRGGVLEIDKKGVVQMLRLLPDSAAEAAKISRLAVTPYEQLPSWPVSELNLDQRNQQKIVDYWGAYKTLYHDIQLVLDEPAEFHMVPSTSYAQMEILQDSVLSIIENLEARAQVCAEDGDCALDESRFPNPYYYAIRLPLPQKVHENNIPDVDKALIFQLKKHGYTASDATLLARILDRENMSAGYSDARPGNFDRLAKQVADKALTTNDFEQVYRILVANTYVRNKASEKCLIGVDTFGCLSNQEISYYESLVEPSLAASTVFENKKITHWDYCLVRGTDNKIFAKICNQELEEVESNTFSLTNTHQLRSGDGCVTANGSEVLTVETCRATEDQVWMAVPAEKIQDNPAEQLSFQVGRERHCLVFWEPKSEVRTDEERTSRCAEIFNTKWAIE